MKSNKKPVIESSAKLKNFIQKKYRHAIKLKMDSKHRRKEKYKQPPQFYAENVRDEKINLKGKLFYSKS